MVTTRSNAIGPASRPVSIPADFGPASNARFTGEITLKGNLWWSGEPLRLNTNTQRELMRLYEIVLTEGLDEDVRNFISYDILMAVFDNLYLPNYVRQAWRDWFDQNSNFSSQC